MIMRGPMPGPSRPINRETLVRITRLFAPYKAQLAWIGLAVLASAALGLASPFFLQTIVNQGLLGRDIGVVTRYTLYTLAATLGGTPFRLGHRYLSPGV